MILKLLSVLLVVAVIYFLFFKKLRKKVDEQNKVDELVECHKCGTFCSKDDTILSNGKYYCSNECLK
jgi:uncharacterized protein